MHRRSMGSAIFADNFVSRQFLGQNFVASWFAQIEKIKMALRGWFNVSKAP